MRFGAFFRCREPYGGCGSFMVYVLRCGWEVGCGIPISSNLPCGAFSVGQEPFGAISAVNHTEPDRTDRKNRTVENPDFFGHFSNIWSDVQNLRPLPPTCRCVCFAFKRLFLLAIGTC